MLGYPNNHMSSRRTMLKKSLCGAGAILTGSPASAGSIVSNPYTDDGAVPWIIDDTSAVADTDSGKVLGYIRNGIRIFKGIPYAEILTTQDRWQRGTKVRPWTGTRSSRAQGPACPGTQDTGRNGPPSDETALHNSDNQVTHARILQRHAVSLGADSV